MMMKFTTQIHSIIWIILSGLCTSLYAQPANNDCGGALPVTMNPEGSCASTVSVVTTNATLSTPSGAGFCANTSGNDDVWYTFTTDPGQTSATLIVSNIVATLGTASNIGCAVYSGTCAGLTQISCVPSGITTSTSLTGLTGSTTYFLRVWAGGGANSATFTICIQAPPSTPPNCATDLAPVGPATLNCTPTPSNIVLSWTAPTTGPTPTGYKVYLGTGTPALLGTSTTTSTAVFNFLPNTTYNWYVVPTNGVDAVGCSTPVSFTTGAEPTCVPNNSCATATMIGSAGTVGTVNSTTVGATISQAGESCAGFTGVPDDDVWFKFTTDSDGGDVTVALTNAAASLDAVMFAYGSCGGLSFACADAGASGGLNETMNLTGLSANTTYLVRVYGYDQFNTVTPTNGTFTLTTSGTGLQAPLPLSLISFTAKQVEEGNLLQWETEQEINTSHVIVERGIDQKVFTSVSPEIKTLGGQRSNDYTWTDNLPLNGNNYYRLRMVDMDGRTDYSPIVVVKNSKNGFGITDVFPSPVQDQLTIQYNSIEEGEVLIRVTDIAGRIVMEQKTEAQKSDNQTIIPVAALNSGIYSVILQNGSSVSTPVKFVKQ
jgi:hypothetical protein